MTRNNKVRISKLASFMMLTLAASAHANIQNPGFENGSTDWSLNGTTSIDSSNAYSGANALRLANKAADGTAEQVLTGLTPNTSYELHVFGKVDHNNTDLDVGVKNYGGATQQVSTSSLSYTELVVNFTTGASDTSATIYAQRLTGSKSAYIDDFSLVASTPDTTAPTLNISSSASSPTTSSPIPLTITFDEQVTGFDSSDLNITNGSVSNFSGDGTVWTMDITPADTGTVDVNVAANSADDLAGNANEASNLFTIEYVFAPDTTAPTVSISSSETSPTASSLIPLTVTFDEAVTGFDQSDLILSNGTVNNFVASGNDMVWTMDLIPTIDGAVDVSIAAGSAADLAGNASEASNLFSITYASTPAVNLVVNGDFENGNVAWDTSWNGSVMRRGEHIYDGARTLRVGHEGNGEGGSGEQVITGLQPNSVYRLRAMAKVRDGSLGAIAIGAKYFNGNLTAVVEKSNDTWELSEVEFATGPGYTSATIFAYRPHSQFTYGYADNFEVVYLRPAPQTVPDPIPTGPCLDPVTSTGNTSYYIDATGGDDCADGLSPATAWSSLFRINATTFAPGDQILLKDTGLWSGVLHPKGSGAAGNHIVLSKYGNGGSEQRPIINGYGVLHAVYLYNQEYFEITNLEVINSAAPDAKKRGIEVENVDAGTLHQIHIKNNYVHDIDGDNQKDVNGSHGIQVVSRVGVAEVVSNFDGIYIENNAVVRADRTAINTSQAWWCRTSVGCIDNTPYAAHTNVLIQNNYIEDAGGDGIVPIASEGALVQYNLVNGANVNSNTPNVAIWTWNADNTLFQYNEAYNTQNTLDGQGFDVDYGQDGTTFQYNYSHDNIGGFFLVATGDWNDSETTNTTIRYNVSQNDHERLYQIFGRADGIKIYNNTAYLPAGSTTKPIAIGNWGGYPSNIEFYNNIFHLDGAGDWTGLENIGGIFVFDSSNIVYGSHTTGEPAGATDVNPMLVAPGTATTGTYNNGVLSFGNFDGYKLQTGSPAIGAGVVIPGAPSVDFWGNAVSPTTPNIGAYAGSGE